MHPTVEARNVLAFRHQLQQANLTDGPPEPLYCKYIETCAGLLLPKLPERDGRYSLLAVN